MRSTKTLFYLSAFIPLFLVLFAHDFISVTYSLTVLVYLLRKKIARFFRGLHVSPILFVIFIITLQGALLELGVWFTDYGKNIFISLPTHLVQFVPFHLIEGVVWAVLLHFWRLSLKKVVIMQSIFALLIEQQAAVLFGVLVNPLVIIFWPYVMAVYTSYVVSAFFIVREIRADK